MTLFEEIIENCLPEGGAAISDAEPILGADVKRLNNEILSKFKSNFPDVKIAPAGSASRVESDDEECGDLDFIVEAPFDENSEIANYLKQEMPGELRILNRFRVYCCSLPYTSVDGREKIVQVDFAFTENFEFTQSLKSGVRKGESEFKNLVKNSLLKTLAKVCPVDGDGMGVELYTGDEYDGLVRQKYPDIIGKEKAGWFYSLNDYSLSLVNRTSLGANGPRTRKPKGSLDGVREPDFTWGGSVLDRQEKTRDFMEAMRIILGPEITMEDTLSVERLVAYLFSGKYPYATPELMNKIKKKTHNHIVEDFKSTRQYPEGTIEQVIEAFDRLWDKYTGGEAVNEMRIIGFKMTDLLRRMH